MLLIAAMGQQNMDSFFLDRDSLIIKSVFYFPVIVTQSIYIDIKPGIFNAGQFPASEKYNIGIPLKRIIKRISAYKILPSDTLWYPGWWKTDNLLP